MSSHFDPNPIPDSVIKRFDLLRDFVLEYHHDKFGGNLTRYLAKIVGTMWPSACMYQSTPPE